MAIYRYLQCGNTNGIKETFLLIVIYCYPYTNAKMYPPLATSRQGQRTKAPAAMPGSYFVLRPRCNNQMFLSILGNMEYNQFQERGGSIVTKKKILVFAVAFVIVYFIGWSVGNTSAINDMNKVIRGNGSSSPASAPATEPIPSPTATPEIKQVELGQVAELGQFEFKVLKAENSKEVKTPTTSISTTTNTYEIVKIEVVNKRNAPADLQDFEFKLTDLDKKITYDINSDVSINLSSTLKIMDKKPAVYLSDSMNPNLKNEFTAVYEVPANANYALGVTYKEDAVTLKLK